MGDDVMLLDEGWMQKCHSTFSSLSESSGISFGLACVAFTNVTFPGMPTFPIIHKSHMEVFGGHVVPDVFINQDGDPFLFQLYRRWCHDLAKRLSYYLYFFSFLFLFLWTYNYKVERGKASRDFVTVSQLV